MLLSEQEYSHAVDILAGRTDREPDRKSVV